MFVCFLAVLIPRQPRHRDSVVLVSDVSPYRRRLSEITSNFMYFVLLFTVSCIIFVIIMVVPDRVGNFRLLC